MTAPPALFDLPLLAHPATPCDALHAIRVRGHWQDQALHLRYTLSGRIGALRLPAPVHAPGPADGLWQHSCLEAFIGAGAGSAYQEFNFSPDGRWAAYAFARERERTAAPTLAAFDPAAQSTTAPQRYELHVRVPRAALPPPSDGGWPLGLSAVIEADDGTLSYWALHHPAPRPDFHQRAGWTAHLPDFASHPNA